MTSENGTGETQAAGNGAAAAVAEAPPANPSADNLRSDAAENPDLLRADTGDRVNFLFNLSTGLGGPGDKTNNVEVTNARQLTEPERNSLFRNSGIIKNLVETYPDEAPWPMWTFSDKPDGEGGDSEEMKLNDYLKACRLGSLEAVLRKTLIEARKDGSAFLLLGIDDGQGWDQPVNEDQSQSIEWVKTLFHNELIRDEVDSPYFEMAYDRKGDGRGIDVEGEQAEGKDTTPNANTDNIGTGFKIHRSRVWEFGGDLLPDTTLVPRGAIKSVSQHQATFVEQVSQ